MTPSPDSCPSRNKIWELSSFQIRNAQFFTSSRISRDCAEAYDEYAAQGPASGGMKKVHFWMESNSLDRLFPMFIQFDPHDPTLGRTSA
jgi:hypothetical protein